MPLIGKVIIIRRVHRSRARTRVASTLRSSAAAQRTSSMRIPSRASNLARALRRKYHSSTLHLFLHPLPPLVLLHVFLLSHSPRPPFTIVTKERMARPEEKNEKYAVHSPAISSFVCRRFPPPPFRGAENAAPRKKRREKARKVINGRVAERQPRCDSETTSTGRIFMKAFSPRAK